MAVTPQEKQAYLDRLANDPQFRELVRRKQDRPEELLRKDQKLTPANTSAAKELRRLIEEEFGA